MGIPEFRYMRIDGASGFNACQWYFEDAAYLPRHKGMFIVGNQIKIVHSLKNATMRSCLSKTLHRILKLVLTITLFPYVILQGIDYYYQRKYMLLTNLPTLFPGPQGSSDAV